MTQPARQTSKSAGTASVFSFPIALIPYTAVVNIIMPQIRIEIETGISIPKEFAIRLEKALPHTALLTPNQPNKEIVNKREIRYFEPAFPKHDCKTTQEGNPKSLPCIDVRQAKNITNPYPIQPASRACPKGIASASSPPISKLGTQIITPA